MCNILNEGRQYIYDLVVIVTGLALSPIFISFPILLMDPAKKDQFTSASQLARDKDVEKK